jgi:hypothetical protein
MLIRWMDDESDPVLKMLGGDSVDLSTQRDGSVPMTRRVGGSLPSYISIGYTMIADPVDLIIL